MTREELQNKHGNAICEYCRKHVISEYNLRKGWVCEKSYHKEAQDGYAAENNIELEDRVWRKLIKAKFRDCFQF